jgi:hypothetical protein
MSWERMKQQKKVKSWQTPYRLFYLSSIATILTVGGTTFFRLKQKQQKQKSERRIKNWFPKLSKPEVKTSFWYQLNNFLKKVFFGNR